MSSQHLFFPGQLEIASRSLKVVRASVSNAFSIPFKQIPRVLFHGFILSLIIAGFWLLDSLKDPVLARIVGIEYQPVAKVISVVTTLIVTCTYDFFTSKLKRVDLFHLVAVVFGLCFMVVSALLADPLVGLANHNERGPHRWLGWFAYVSIESYGSLMVALFWSFTNSTMNLEEAKGAYGLIIAVAQIGAIGGSTLATHAKTIGIPQLFLIGAMGIFSVSLFIKVYCICFPKIANADLVIKDAEFEEEGSGDRELRSHSGRLYGNIYSSAAGSLTGTGSDVESSSLEKGAQPSFFQGFVDGLRLVVRSKYMLLVFGVTCLYEVVVTILDYQFKILGVAANSIPIEAAPVAWGVESNGEQSLGEGVSEDQFANLLGHFGQATNIFSFLVSFFGFSFLVHRIGVRASLMIFPTVLFAAVVATNLMPNLTVLFISVSIIKALVFSLHDPVKELLYIPTSLPIKFKAKAWIDVFGARLAKATGSLIAYISYGDAKLLRTIAEIPCLLIAVGVLILAYLTGTEFQNLVDKGERVK